MPPPATPSPRASVTTSVQKPRNVPARPAGLMSIIRPSVPTFHSPSPKPSRISPGVTSARSPAAPAKASSANVAASSPTPMDDMTVLVSRL